MDLEYVKRINWTPINIAKALGLFLVFLLILSGVLAVIKPDAQSGYGGMMIGAEPMYDVDSYPDMGRGVPTMYEESAKLSLTNIGIPVPRPGGIPTDAEDYEVTEYSATIEANDKAETCLGISKLKELSYVIFETRSDSEYSCNFTFKVEHDHVDEVTAILKTYRPKDFTESAYTIKRELDDFTNATDVLVKKLASIDATLKGAEDAYDDVMEIATRTGNAEALASIISSRLSIIERLTGERLNVVSELERLARAKNEAEDRLLYTYFSVYVYENTYVDFEAIADSWKLAIQTFIVDTNRIIQDMSVNLITFVLIIVQYALYLGILLVLGKYAYRVGKKFIKS